MPGCGARPDDNFAEGFAADCVGGIRGGDSGDYGREEQKDEE